MHCNFMNVLVYWYFVCLVTSINTVQHGTIMNAQYIFMTAYYRRLARVVGQNNVNFKKAHNGSDTC